MNRLPFIRRWFYTGRRAIPVQRRPHPAWPPQRDPWMANSETQILPPYPVYERKEQ